MAKKDLGILGAFKGEEKEANEPFELKAKNIVSKKRIGKNVLINDEEGKGNSGPSYGGNKKTIIRIKELKS